MMIQFFHDSGIDYVHLEGVWYARSEIWSVTQRHHGLVIELAGTDAIAASSAADPPDNIVRVTLTGVDAAAFYLWYKGGPS